MTHAAALTQILEALRQTGEPDWSLVDDDFEIHDHDLPDSIAHRGRGGWRAWSEGWVQVFPEYGIEPGERVELDSRRTLTFHRLRARGRVSGVELERIDAQVWTFDGDRLTRMDYYPNFEPGTQTWTPPGGRPESII